MTNRYSKTDSVVYFAAKAAVQVVSAMPLGLALALGRFIGICMYHLHPRRKRIAYANLKAAFSNERSPEELKAILKRTYQNYGQMIMESLGIARINVEYLKKHISIEGLDNFLEAYGKNSGVVFLGSHFGNWELSNLKSAQEGFPVSMFVRPLENEKLEGLFRGYREKLGCKVVSRGMSSREMIRALRGGKAVGMVGDQDVGKSGLFIDLLGRPASHASGAARFARNAGSFIVPFFVIRQNGPDHLIKIERPITVARTEDRDSDLKNALGQYTGLLESYIRRHPDQWMWVYTRWKSTPARKIIILSDGKKGHLNQSLAAADVLKRCRRDAGFRDEDTDVKVIDVRCKNRFARFFLSLCAVFASHACQGSMACLKLCLTGESYKWVSRVYADIVISCGSSLSAASVFLARENNARNVIMMKPSIIPLWGFDIAVIPEHDRPVERDNVVITRGSPNVINEDAVRRGQETIRALSSLTGRSRMGLLLGGDTPEYRMTPELIGRLIDEVAGTLEKRDMELLVTTSRRTPGPVEDMLKERLRSNPRCKLLVIANENNPPNVVSGILGESDFVLVSGESISMVSEAASSGRHTLVFDLESKNLAGKHRRAIQRLASEGYVVKAPIDKIGEIIEELAREKREPKRLSNEEKMYEKLYRII